MTIAPESQKRSHLIAKRSEVNRSEDCESHRSTVTLISRDVPEPVDIS